MNRYSLILFSVVFALISLSQVNAQVDGKQVLRDLQILSEDSMQGRGVATPGGAKARKYLLKRFKEIGLQQYSGTYEFQFEFEEEDHFVEGVNVVGYLPGKSDSAIVLTAHYDHLGIREGQIYNGADDNASGVAGILAVAEALKDFDLNHTLIVIAFDAEEHGLQGAKAFVDSPIIPLSSILFNINLDMISHNDNNEIYVAGTHHYPELLPLLQTINEGTKVDVLAGHDKPELGHDDWTSASDHAPFHANKIPFFYFGVEDHPDYHKPSDEFQNTNKKFLVDVVNMLVDAVKQVDSYLP